MATTHNQFDFKPEYSKRKQPRGPWRKHIAATWTMAQARWRHRPRWHSERSAKARI